MKHKGLAFLGLVTGLSVAGSMVTFAENNHQFIRDDGIITFVYDYRNEWVWRDPDGDGIEECYYFNDIGEIARSKITPDKYVTDSSGAWVQNNVVQQRHVADGTPLNVSVHKDEATGKKVFNVEGIEIVAEVPAKTNHTWVQGGWVGDPGVGEPTGTNYCTVDDINLFKCQYTKIFHGGNDQKVLAVTFIINGKMTERNNSQTGYAGGNYKFFDTETKQEYQQTLGGYKNGFVSAKSTLQDTIFNYSCTENLAVGDSYYTDITLCIPVGVNSCTLQFYEE